MNRSGNDAIYIIYEFSPVYGAINISKLQLETLETLRMDYECMLFSLHWQQTVECIFYQFYAVKTTKRK